MSYSAIDLETQSAPKQARSSMTKMVVAALAVASAVVVFATVRSMAAPGIANPRNREHFGRAPDISIACLNPVYSHPNPRSEPSNTHSEFPNSAPMMYVGAGYSMAATRPAMMSPVHTSMRAMSPVGRFSMSKQNTKIGMKAASSSSRAALRVNASPEKKMSVSDLSKDELNGKVALVRCDLNVPLDGKTITDDTRIRASIPTIKYLVDNGAKVLLTSHLGRPKDGPEDKFSLAPVAARLSELLGQDVTFVSDCIGEPVKEAVASMSAGSVALLENVRFYKEETKNDPDFAKKLAANADLFVNDAFGTAHRAHGSTEGVTKYLTPSVAGFLLQKELDYLQGAVAEPARPFAAIVGGSKVSSKIGVIESLLEKCDKLIIGGGMVFTFLKARGLEVGTSLVEEDKLELAKNLERIAKEKGVELILPSDVILADAFSADANTQVADASAIPEGWMGLDQGPKATEEIVKALGECKTVIWN
eukprot:216933-Amorphochlora_amoeboformis.AAC.1